ncbi:MAG: hypothetical protein IPJ34_09345 [Myxococcales bacterium]|nr:hypothetical protein [Myxococcales bacterium]
MQHRLAPEVLVFAAEADHPEWAQATVHALDDGDGGRAELLAHDREQAFDQRALVDRALEPREGPRDRARALPLGERARDDLREVALHALELGQGCARRGVEQVDGVADRVDRSALGLERVGGAHLPIEADGERGLHVGAHAIARVEADPHLARHRAIGVAAAVHAERLAQGDAIAERGRIAQQGAGTGHPAARPLARLEQVGGEAEHAQDGATGVAQETGALEIGDRLGHPIELVLGGGLHDRAQRPRTQIGAAQLELARHARIERLEGEQVGDLSEPGRALEGPRLGQLGAPAPQRHDRGQECARRRVLARQVSCGVEVNGGAILVVHDGGHLGEAELAHRHERRTIRCRRRSSTSSPSAPGSLPDQQRARARRMAAIGRPVSAAASRARSLASRVAASHEDAVDEGTITTIVSESRSRRPRNARCRGRRARR